MTDKPNDGGPAFPVPMIPLDNEGGYTEVRWQGMTLREYFAGQALAGMAGVVSPDSYSTIAQMAVAYADALIAELQK